MVESRLILRAEDPPAFLTKGGGESQAFLVEAEFCALMSIFDKTRGLWVCGVWSDNDRARLHLAPVTKGGGVRAVWRLKNVRR
jgi:hypothetical protein